ncbi:MAG: class I SAM-dependent methyltransferase [Bacteroidetes bacterium]|nr:MAG: class I SAM-dependent methyltransferase [Bacteroidota bacterium]REK04768.1 MAG: class I SAM-dependent methyltransferase [Bacteroidota bacterium]REK36242.1 MAG: class I SAM-dependent methyltransferase [Bacteroidota bacterium]REK51096.1 MAG: class I SAM-dependent methyltransferase [Bacteroidota bacterium]
MNPEQSYINAFDLAARDYDDEFSNTWTGKAQRERVHYFLAKDLAKGILLNILELNCGTGVDAIYLSGEGHNITAIDASPEMIRICKSKADRYDTNKIKFIEADIKTFVSAEQQFDYIYSNFGGLNCLNQNELRKLSASAASWLKPGGRISMVIMGRHCFTEMLYFLFKGKYKMIGRRNTNEATNVNVHGELCETWYYSPTDIQNIFATEFTLVRYKPVGLFLPPSYLNNFYKAKPLLKKAALKMEKTIGTFSWFANWSDHYFIELQKKSL